MVSRKEDCDILSGYPFQLLKENGVNAEIHVITGSVEVAPGIGLADAISIL